MSRIKQNIVFIYIFFILTFFLACQRAKKPNPNPSIPPKFALQKEPVFNKQGVLYFTNKHTDTITNIEIEIADTPKKRETGLMHRHKMGTNQGMLFIFDKEERQSFWMKNTHIPLDIIFVNQEKTIVHIAENCQPYSLKSIPSFEYAKYVVEVNAGFANKYDLRIGDSINF
jgi:uncharacterized membrane protein (UPF0127 family)